MTTATATAPSRAPVVEEPRSAKVLRVLGKAPIQVLLVVVGLLWLVPTFGLLITSLIAPEDFAEGGWWRVFTQPSLLTWMFRHYLNICPPEVAAAAAAERGGYGRAVSAAA